MPVNYTIAYYALSSAPVANRKKYLKKFKKILDKPKKTLYNNRKFKKAPDRGADMMSTPRYTPASGGGGKAVPPKLFRGCRRGAAGVAFNRRGTVAYFCGELS